MSIDGLKVGYLNCGFTDDSSSLPLGALSTEPNKGKSEVNAHELVQKNSSANRVHFFRRVQNQTEDTSLLVDSHETVSYFVQPTSGYNHSFKRFRKTYISVTLSDCLHKIVYYSLVANFVLYARKCLSLNAVESVTSSYGLVICFMLLSAGIVVLRDFSSKKLPLIFLGFTVYIIGLSILVWATQNISKEVKWSSIIALFLVCFGEGVVRSVLPELGSATTWKEGIENRKKLVWRMHWITNAFVVIAIGFITALEQNFNFNLAFCIRITLVLLGFVLFLMPIKQYKVEHVSNAGTIRLALNVLKEAKHVKNAFYSKKKGSAIVDQEDSERDASPSVSWINFAKSSQGGTYEDSEVDAVECLYYVTLLFLCLIPYWILHAQCYTTYYYQGMHLDTRVGNTHMPVAWMSLFSIAVVMVLAPFCDLLIFPALEAHEISFPIAWRMLCGLIFGCLSAILAGCIESFGISYAKSGYFIRQCIGEMEITGVTLSIFAQIPQYFFLALSEVFTALTALNVACQLCSGGFRRLASSLYYLTISAGYIIALVILVFGWYPEQRYFINDSVKVYFFVLAGLMLVNALVLAAVIYKIVDIPSRIWIN